MKTAGVVVLALLTLCAAATTTPAASDGVERHSGTVVTIDDLRDVITIDEIGAWDAATEQARVTRRHIHVTGLTEYKVFVRSTVRGGFRDDFVEFPLDIVALSKGDTVTAECVRAGRVLVALTIVVADVP